MGYIHIFKCKTPPPDSVQVRPHTCNPWMSGGAEASVDGAVGVGVAAAGREACCRRPYSCHRGLS